MRAGACGCVRSEGDAPAARMQAAHVRLWRRAAGVHHDDGEARGASRLCRDLVAEHRDRAGAGRSGPGEPQAVGQHAVRPKIIGRAREWHAHFAPMQAQWPNSPVLLGRHYSLVSERGGFLADTIATDKDSNYRWRAYRATASTTPASAAAAEAAFPQQRTLTTTALLRAM